MQMFNVLQKEINELMFTTLIFSSTAEAFLGEE